jgi:uncharacterized protein Yka (UPF0111/DUF47 family)
VWLDRAVKWLLPREEHFFDLLERGADRALASGGLLAACCEAATPEERESFVAKMTVEEHAADQVIHEVYDALNKTFVTPLDRTDIYTLATDLENITDRVDEAMTQIRLHDIVTLPTGSRELGAKVKLACEAIQAAVRLLRGLKDIDAIRARCKAVSNLEREGDQIFSSTIAELFRTEKDAIVLLKHKEFLESIERILDACDDVANALDNLIIKNA